jgi:hypothetical protein
MRISMTVLRDGYWEGAYARPGDVIAVDPEWVDALEVAGFAMREAAPTMAGEGRKRHGR